MTEKKLIVPFMGKSPKKSKPARNYLLLYLKKNELELGFYSDLDPELMTQLIEKIL